MVLVADVHELVVGHRQPVEGPERALLASFPLFEYCSAGVQVVVELGLVAAPRFLAVGGQEIYLMQ